MSEFFADPSVGGDGSRTTDDDNPTTGLGNGGFWTRLVPMFRNVVNIAAFVRDRAVAIAQQSQIASNAAVTAVDAANTAVAKAAFQDNQAVVQRSTDTTRQLRFDLSGVATNTTVVLTAPATGGTVATTAVVDAKISAAADSTLQGQKRAASALSY